MLLRITLTLIAIRDKLRISLPQHRLVMVLIVIKGKIDSWRYECRFFKRESESVLYSIESTCVVWESFSRN